MYFGMPAIGLGGNAVHNYAKNGQAVAAHRSVARPLAAELSRVHGCRLSAEPSGAADRQWRGARAPTVLTRTSGRFRRTSRAGNISCGIGSRPTPICGAMRAMPGTGSRVRAIPPALANKVIARTAEAVRRIRARGGDVIFIRPPSAPQLRVNEQKRIPRELGWDGCWSAPTQGNSRRRSAAGAEAGTPEWSHLSHKCAAVFTDAYVRRLVELTQRLKLRPNGPPALDRRDCVPAAQAGVTSSAASRAPL